MVQIQTAKHYDLEERTLIFSRNLIKALKQLPSNTINFKLVDQCIRSGTSIGANYREANETETKRDFQFRVRICRKEAKETAYWLTLIGDANPTFSKTLEPLLSEANQFVKIFAAIIEKTKT